MHFKESKYISITCVNPIKAGINPQEANLSVAFGLFYRFLGQRVPFSSC